MARFAKFFLVVAVLVGAFGLVGTADADAGWFGNGHHGYHGYHHAPSHGYHGSYYVPTYHTPNYYHGYHSWGHGFHGW